MEHRGFLEAKWGVIKMHQWYFCCFENRLQKAQLTLVKYGSKSFECKLAKLDQELLTVLGLKYQTYFFFHQYDEEVSSKKSHN